MRNFELKYGFLTTYNSTLFLKQEGTESDPILYCSAPMDSATASSSEKPSLRECLFYLQYLVKDTEENPEPWRFINEASTDDRNGIQWFVKRGKGENVPEFKARRNRALGEVNESLEKWRHSQSKRSRGSHGESAGGLESKGKALASDFSKLTMREPQPTKKTRTTRPPKEVTFEDTKGSSTSGGKKKT